jgi:alcohol dehydrogenase class IV
VLAFNRPAIEERLGRAAAYLGISGGYDGFARAVLKLRQQLNVPHTLSELLKGAKLDGERKTMIAEMAVADPSTGTNPVELTKEAALRILEASLEG